MALSMNPAIMILTTEESFFLPSKKATGIVYIFWKETGNVFGVTE
jgi:hypothetical protein